MNANHVELWQRLEQFQLDSSEAALPFSARLARENNWTNHHTQRVIVEYKRFAFLAIAAGHPVSPSEDVDQAWHLHLTYSENYWKVFCPKILGKPLHHQPTQGGRLERDKFDDWYAHTLQSYKNFFGNAPPQDIWPAPESRRNEKHDFVRVDRDRNWVVPKPRLRLNPKRALLIVLPLVAVCCTGAVLAQSTNALNWRGTDFLGLYVLLFAGCTAVAIWLRRKLRMPNASESLQMPELDGYATAYLNGGRVLAANAAIANLIRQKAMRVDTKSKRLVSLVPRPALEHVLERVVYSAAASSTDGNTIANVRLSAKPVIANIAEDLKARGLVVNDAMARKAIAAPLVISFAAVAIGVIKIFVGVGRDKPVGFLVVLCFVSLVIALVTFARRPLRSRYGDAVLKELQARHIGSRRLVGNASGITAAEFATVVGLFGMTALAGGELNDLRKALQPPGGSGCGSSGCGGSGCGGGGCGGCGGD